MTKQEQVKAIFIEEAGEIIEKLDIDIIRFEENSSDHDLLNEIFRGVHTLKGNANAFGFTRLGEFVHHFEDLLDYYRSSKESIEPENLELFVNSVDVIKEVMACELDAVETLPEDYDKCLEQIKVLLDLKKGVKNSAKEIQTDGSLHDLASEFGSVLVEDDKPDIVGCIEAHKAMYEEGLNLYHIDLTLDDDCYKRGFDHIIFLNNLAHKAKSIESFFDLREIPKIEEFRSDENRIKRVDIIVLTPFVFSEIDEEFEFLFDHEYTIAQIDVTVKKETPAVQKEKSQHVNNTAHPTLVTSKSTIRIDTFKLDELFDSVGELVIAQNFIAQNQEIRSIEDESVAKAIETLSKITKRIQDRVMSLRMVAIKDTFEKMKRVVRDTSKKTGKDLHLIIQGEETEIDKTMVDSLSDPLIHIIRNAIDHGLESSGEDRTSVGKDAQGTVTLKAFHKSGNIVINVTDDGKGINKEKVFKKAIEQGIISGEENMSDAQIYGLIMQPGFSTAEQVSDLSGRGVGLDVVRNSIEKLRGKIDVDSKSGQGTSFSMILPLTLAIIDGMLVRVANNTYIIPTLSVVESFRPEEKIVHIVKNKGEFVSLRGQHIPIIRLSEVLNLSVERIVPWEGILVCVETSAGRIAVMVDELVGRQQVVIKSLGKSLAKLKEISGGAILGNGDIALILNIDALRPFTESVHA
jgi:two-component system, chemotaxis family, sensor kinase CheA